MATRLRIQVTFQSGQSLYVVLVNVLTGQAWNNSSKVFETYNSANWAQYAVPLTELTGSGIYAAAYPSQIGVAVTTEALYNNASPTLGDAPQAAIMQSQGQNVAAVAGDADVPDTLQQALTSEARGAAAGVPTASVIPTTLTNVQASAYQGRAVVFTSGVAFQAVGRIVSYAPINGVLVLAAPLPVAPGAGDTFVIF